MTLMFPDLIVNGERVPADVVAQEAQHHEAPKGKPGIAWRKAANAIAIRTLLLQEAARREIVPDPQELEPGRFETDEDAIIRALIDTAVKIEAPSDDALYAEWARDPARFRAPPLWEVSHILIACDPRERTQTDIARKRAVALLEKIHAHPNEFGTIARDNSDCGSKSANGFLGQLGPGDTVPEFEAALRTLNEGEITPEPVLSRHGWHIIRMEAVAEGAVLPFEAVRPKLTEAMEKAAWAEAAQAFVNSLVASADVQGAELKPV